MKKKAIAVLLILTLLVFSVFAEEEVYIPDEEELNSVMGVVVDCIASTFVTNYSSANILLPCSTVSFDYSLNLPRRVSFFLADPYDYMTILEKYVETEGGVLSGLISLFNKTSRDPFLTVIYLAMEAKDYQPNNYLVSGGCSFTYPQDTTIEKLANIWLKREQLNGNLEIFIDMSVFGNKPKGSVSFYGPFSLFVNEEKQIIVETKEGFTINGKDFGNLFLSF